MLTQALLSIGDQILIVAVGDTIKFKININPVEEGTVVEIFPSGLMFVRIKTWAMVWNNGSPRIVGFDVPIKPENIILP